jgi:hypothetical protein
MLTLSDQSISVRAEAIAEGLLRSGRAEPPVQRISGNLRLHCITGDPRHYYLIPGDGSFVLRGEALLTVEELPKSFVEAMIRVGRAEVGLHCVPSRSERIRVRTIARGP